MFPRGFVASTFFRFAIHAKIKNPTGLTTTQNVKSCHSWPDNVTIRFAVRIWSYEKCHAILVLNLEWTALHYPDKTKGFVCH